MGKEAKRREGKKRSTWIIEVDVRALLMLIVTVVMCIFFVVSCVLFVRGLMRIQSFEIRGMSDRYDREELVNASLVSRGDLLYGISYREAEENILKGCPYLESVTVTDKFPNTLCITVVERAPQWYIALADDFYVLDSDLVMLTETHSEEELIAQHVTRLVLPSLKSVMRGSVPVFALDEKGERDEQTTRRVIEIVDTIRQTSFKRRITELDVSNLTNVSLVVEGKYRVELGDATHKLEGRLQEVERIIDTAEVRAHESGTLYAASSPAYFKPQNER